MLGSITRGTIMKQSCSSITVISPTILPCLSSNSPRRNHDNSMARLIDLPVEVRRPISIFPSLISDLSLTAALRIRALRGFTCTPSDLQNLVSHFQRCACIVSRTIPHRMHRSISHARAYHHQNPKIPPLQPGRLGGIPPDVHQRNRRLVEAPSARTSPTPISLAIRPAHVHVQSQYPCSLWARTQCDGDGDPAMDGT